jgi:hypothetical protein
MSESRQMEKNSVRNPWQFLSLLLAAFTLVSCGGGGSSDDPPTVDPDLKALVRVLHASPDTPSANVFINGNQELQNVPYKTGSGFLELDPGTYNFRMEGIVPTGTETIVDVVRALQGFQEYTLIAVNNRAAIEPLVVENPIASLAAGVARLQVVHAAPDVSLVDVYVTPPGADLSANAPVGSAAFKGIVPPTEIPAGNYQIRVTAAGNPANVIFDSGTIAVTEDDDLLFTAVENTGPGTAPISLVKLDGERSEDILDQNAPANVRVIHASPDTLAVDVVVNNNFSNPLVQDLAFPNVTAFVSVLPGEYNIKVTGANNPGVIPIDFDTTLAEGTANSVYALGPLATLQPLVLEDDLRSIATEAKVRLVHASPTAGAVDIYITAPNTDINTVDPNVVNLEFANATDYLSLIGGNYTVTITPTGSKTPAIGPTPINLVNGGVYTAAARDAVGGGLVSQDLILMDDFVTSSSATP